MKKTFSFVAFLLALIMILSAFSCSKPGNDPKMTEPSPDGETEPDTKAPETKAPETKTPETKPAETKPRETKPVETEDPMKYIIEIGTAEELRAFNDSFNKKEMDYTGYTVRLTADIDLSGENWTPLNVGRYDEFCFDGQGHTISGMTIDGNTQLGFFSQLPTSKYLYVMNVTFDNTHITATGKHIAVVLGEVNGGYATFSKVNVKNFVIDGATGINPETDTVSLDVISIRVAGLVGIVMHAAYIELDECRVENGTMSGYHNVSGLIGYNECPENSVIQNCRVENVECSYSVGYSQKAKSGNDDYDEAAGMAYARKVGGQVFYNDAQWTNHEEIDEENGNTYYENKFIDLGYGITYYNLEDMSYNEE